ncbi:hypothetical protein NM688_g185 [Phlebia brevispora]|uniref:Uncharacterized protein n=1 Tax=Phlebia brevispora TaxID=194682 RepID=A0ACC1TF76_9APHY|nr:hypothetical protein NM688_g185 [Phlebia brevispora]
MLILRIQSRDIMGDQPAHALKIDVLEWMSCTMVLEDGPRTGFGYSFDLLSLDMYNRAGHAMTQLVPANTKATLWRSVSRYRVFLRPVWLTRLLARLTPESSFRRIKCVTEAISEETTNVLHDRRTGFERKNEQCEDIGSRNMPNTILMKESTSIVRTTLMLHGRSSMCFRLPAAGIVFGGWAAHEDDDWVLSTPLYGRDGRLIDYILVPRGTSTRIFGPKTPWMETSQVAITFT